MFKKERFERFIKLYESDKDIDLTWDDQSNDYKFKNAKLAYNLYEDLYKYDKQYKKDILKGFSIALFFTLIMVLTVLFIGFLDNFLISIFNIPYNSFISLCVTGFFFFIFILLFIRLTFKTLT